ncbi:MAG TPA: hypothetical protein PKZ77_01875, partial [Pseudomonadales bacterium]|nr:hypothetical protein [Pseudomonadales bacterium]
ELKWAENLARMLQVSGVAYCTSGIFLGMAYFDYIYLLVALVVATRQLVASHLAAQAPATQSAFATQVRPRRRDFNPADAGRISARRGSGFNPTFPSA